MFKLFVSYACFLYGIFCTLSYGYAMQWLTIGYGLHPMLAGAVMFACIVAPCVMHIAMRSSSHSIGGQFE